jgi:zinc transporter, ZIP family
MVKAVVFGLIASSSLLIGALIAVALGDLPERRQRTVDKVNKGVLAFGAGVLLCTLSFNLMEDAFQKGGFDHAIIGFLTGALMFVVLDLFVDRLGSGWELLLGALLDGIPESAVVGIGLIAGKGLGFLMMVAVFLSNLPESLSGARDMLDPPVQGQKRYSKRETVGLWAAVTGICFASTIVGYAVFGNSSQSAIAFMLAVAAGAILAMVTHTMIPDAFSKLPKSAEKSRLPGKRVLRIYDKIEAMAVVGGFLVAFILSKVTG